jgi:hypothetical protein
MIFNRSGKEKRDGQGLIIRKGLKQDRTSREQGGLPPWKNTNEFKA